MDYKQLVEDVEDYTTGQVDFVSNTANVASLIWHAFQQAQRPINWAGFYFVRPIENPKPKDVHGQMLTLGPFIGKPACTRIRFQDGVCGAAVRSKSVQRVDDVHCFEGHIACDKASQSEIVVPLLNDQQEVVAVLDLDCPEPKGFTPEDEKYLGQIGQIVAQATTWSNLALSFRQ